MPASLSKLRRQINNPNATCEDYNWYIKSKDNPKNIINTPQQQELKQWRKVVNGIHTTKKQTRKECQQSSLNCSTKETSP